MRKTLSGAVVRLIGGTLIGLATAISMFLAQHAIEGMINPLDWWHYFWIVAGIGGFSGAVIGIAWAITHILKSAIRTTDLSR